MLIPETISLHDRLKFKFFTGYFLPWKHQLTKEIWQVGGDVICFDKHNNWQILNSVKEVSRFVKDQKIQLIHAHLPWAGILARRVHKRTGVPLIYTEHNRQERYHFATRAINRFTFDNEDLVIAVSNSVKESIERNINPKIPVKAIHNGVNTSKFNPFNFEKLTARIDLGIPQESLVIGTVAVFRKQKRLDVWVKLASQIKERHPESFFILLGSGPEEDAIRNEIKRENLEDSFLLPGRLKDVRLWLAAMDIYMMTSEFEGLPIAMLEAMSMRLPLISTDAGGIKEVIRNGEEGYLVSVHSPEALVEPALELARDKLKREEMGIKGRNRVLKGFSLERMVKELEQTYLEILSTRGII